VGELPPSNFAMVTWAHYQSDVKKQEKKKEKTFTFILANPYREEYKI
jgi:hypothetical protein